MKKAFVCNLMMRVTFMLLILLLILPAAGCGAGEKASKNNTQLSNAELSLSEKDLDRLISTMDASLRQLRGVDFTKLSLGAPIYIYEYKIPPLPKRGGPSYIFEESGVFYPVFYRERVVADIIVRSSYDGKSEPWLNVGYYHWLNSAQGSSIALIYAYEGGYLFDGVDFTLAEKDNSHQNITRGTITDLRIADMSGVVLTDFTVTTPINYTPAADE